MPKAPTRPRKGLDSTALLLSAARARVLETVEQHEQIPAGLVDPKHLEALQRLGGLVVDKAGMAKPGPTSEKLLDAWAAVAEYRASTEADA